MAKLKHYNYTVSNEAKLGLHAQFSSYIQSTRQSEWRRKPEKGIDAFGQPYTTNDASGQHVEGLSYALDTCAEQYDLYEWLAKPTPNPYTHTREPIYYNPPDPFYLQDMQDDDTPWLELTRGEQQDRLTELRRVRGWHPERGGIPDSAGKIKQPGYSSLTLSLRPSTRKYYHQLRLFHHIPLLPKCRSPHSLTTSVGAVLEAIGTKHLILPHPDYYLKIEANPRKSYIARHRQHRTVDGHRRYGNFAGTPYTRREWRAIPPISNPESWTQQDIDYCIANPSLADLVQPILDQRPDLCLPLDSSPPVWRDQPEAKINRKLPKIELTPSAPQAATYLYKGKDVTQAVILAHERHYTDGQPYTAEPIQSIAQDYAIPKQTLRLLVAREHVRRITSDFKTTA